MVFAITAPQPSRKARWMTLRLVPGGPEPMTNGFGSLRPSTRVVRVGMAISWMKQLSCEKEKRTRSRAARRAVRCLGLAVECGVIRSRFQATKPIFIRACAWAAAPRRVRARGFNRGKFFFNMNAPLNPKRPLAELKELRALTGDDNGAQRVAFTPTWTKARAWLRE